MSVPYIIVLGLIVSSGVGVAQEKALKIVPVGPEQIVASAEDKSCPELHDPWIHVPDTPISAFKRADGSVVLLAVNRRGLALSGPSVEAVGPSECKPVLVSRHDGDPAKYADNEWMSAVLKLPNGSYMAFVHDEYHGYDHQLADCKVSRGELQSHRCWYASTTLATSEDGGVSFHQPEKVQVIAAPQIPFTPQVDRIGFGNPKAIISPKDHIPYLMISSYGDIGEQKKGQCLFRGDVHDPSRWLAWNGSSFSMEMKGAYSKEHASGVCKVVIPDNIESIRFDKTLDVFLALGQVGRDVVCFYSRDLISWSKPSIIGSLTSLRGWKEGDPAPTYYYSLLDPTSSSANFDTIEGKPYLYFVRWHVEDGHPANDKRDIVRQPIDIRFAR